MTSQALGNLQTTTCQKLICCYTNLSYVTMDTGNTIQDMEKKLQRAIDFLELLQLQRTSAILEYLQWQGEADYSALLIQFPKGNIQRDLERLVESSILLKTEVYYQPVYRINREKLERVFRATAPVFKVSVGIDVVD